MFSEQYEMTRPGPMVDGIGGYMAAAVYCIARCRLTNKLCAYINCCGDAHQKCIGAYAVRPVRGRYRYHLHINDHSFHPVEEPTH